MHIREICLEGFKSYATRTVVPDFDPFFNAITGLNGSGKSNILDSICFVLGITNLQQVRAANLQELVYKQGQAGVTKATVSIVFDNSNRARSPIGFEDCSEITVTRQIVVGGRNKYMINGHVAQPSRVQNLFHSVQLNVNNPHFLIMQGRITKVLNMKPPEILSMLEEAAGTRMYEMKKESALKTLEKKQTKVVEIDNVLAQEILPALEKLRKERAQYMQWANANAELDRLKRFCIAYEYVQAEKVKDAAIIGVEEMKSKIEELKNSMEQIKVEIAEKEQEIAVLASEKEKHMSGEMKTLSDRVDKCSNVLVQETSALSNQKENLKSEQKAIAKLKKGIQEIEKSIKEKETAVQRCDDGAADLKRKVEELTKSLEDYEKEYQGVLAGKSSGEEEKCLDDQLVDAKTAVGGAETEVKQLKTKISHLEKELKDKQKQMQSKQKEADAVEKEREMKRREVEKIKAALEGIEYEEGQMETLEQERSKLINEVQRLKADVRSLSAELGNIQFTYRDPASNFDRSKVKGVVAQLIEVNEDSTMTALEVTAGGKLFNVVVDTEQTGKLLLERGGLRRRVTIIPLNKIDASTIPSQTQELAASVVSQKATVALCLIRYPEETHEAMVYVFGNTFVCSNSDDAKKIAFNRQIRYPSVTLQGDVFQPSGFLTGGSRRGGGQLLRGLKALKESEGKLAYHQNKLTEIEAEIKRLQPIYKKFTELNTQLNLKSYDLSLFETRAQQNEHHKLSEQVTAMEEELKELKLAVKSKGEFHKACIAKVSELEGTIKEHSRDRESRLAGLEKKIKTVKQQMASSSKEFKGHEGEKERLVMELEAVVQEKSSLKSQLATCETQIKVLEEELEKVIDKVDIVKKDHNEALAELNANRAKIKERDVQINSLAKIQHKLQQKLSDGNIDGKRMDNEIKRLELEQKECSSKVDRLLEKHEWIKTEKQLFGRSGSDYDFGSCDPKKARDRYESLQAEQSNLEKRVNKKVMTMFEKAEDEYKNLMSKKSIIENDKSKIHKVIQELDEKKKETLKMTWVKVNKDFGSIFSTLLPGTMAKLEPQEGASFLDGLEVRVAFGSVWKQSLSELSGGQRSLLALSLILALLLFKPAPLYILDEVDAALDLSHTQNIGRMIKAHFPHSQFVVVSLKEGMFNNANVIFRTKFVDGVSTVTRTVPRHSK